MDTTVDDIVQEIVDREINESHGKLLDHGILYIGFQQPLLSDFWKLDQRIRKGIRLHDGIATGPISAWAELFNNTQPHDAINGSYLLSIALRERLRAIYPIFFGKKTVSGQEIAFNASMLRTLSQQNIIELSENKNIGGKQIRDLIFRTVCVTTDMLTAMCLEDHVRHSKDTYVLKQTDTTGGPEELFCRKEPETIWPYNADQTEIRLLCEDLERETDAIMTKNVMMNPYQHLLPMQPLATRISLVITAPMNSWYDILTFKEMDRCDARIPYLKHVIKKIAPLLYPNDDLFS